MPNAPTTQALTNAAAADFADLWKNRGFNERGDTPPFWLALLGLLGVQNPENDFIRFEDPVQLDAGSRGSIDAYIPSTRVLVEQKHGLNLAVPQRQSDGTFLTPFQQAKRYANALPADLPESAVVAHLFRLYKTLATP